jgi:Zn-dependent protease with chaperone function
VSADVPARAPVLSLTALLGGAGIAAAGAAVGTAIGSVHHVAVGAGRLAVAGLAFSYPTLNAAAALILALAAAGALTIAAALRAGWRQRRAHRRFLAQVEVLGKLHGHPAVTVIAGARPEAFCAGFLRPAIYVSRGAVNALTAPQLEAVLAHEHHHRRVRDPLRFACARVLAQAVFFIPVLRPLRDRYAELAELRADRAAVCANAGRPSTLASALLAFDAGSPSGRSGVSAARVDSLLGEPDRWRVARGPLIGSLAVLAVVSIMIWRSSAAASAQATFNAPLFSSAPCLSLLLIVPPLLWVVVTRLRPRARLRLRAARA